MRRLAAQLGQLTLVLMTISRVTRYIPFGGRSQSGASEHRSASGR